MTEQGGRQAAIQNEGNMSDQSGRDDAEFEIMSRLVRGIMNQDDKAKLFALNKIVDTGIAGYKRPTPEPMEETNGRTQS